MSIANVVALLGGLGFFLFGMSLLGDGLTRVAGRKLETILERLTSTTFKGVVLGTVVTTLIQSSSATTVMVVGFVNSGIMKLRNAIGIIMGANIGTTATGWILVLAGLTGRGGISSSTIFAFVAFVGIILYFFCKKDSKKNIGMILLAFSVLMSGMQSMSGAMAPLRQSPLFLSFISAVSNPLISMLVGAVVTAIIQSASASIGILQALSITGVIGYDVAIPMVVGMCIGAAAPILISAIGANVSGKRTAFIYLYFNAVGAIILMPIFYLVHAFVDFGFMSEMATSMGVAVVNTVFNAVATVVLAPMTGLMEKLTIYTIREKEGDSDSFDESTLLDERFLEFPPLAIEQSGKTMELMSNSSFKSIQYATDVLNEFETDKFNRVNSLEAKVDRYEDALGAYLIRLNTKALSEAETQTIARYLTCLTNIERISDHAKNIAELAKELSEKKLRFSATAEKEMHTCIAALFELLGLTRKALLENDIEAAKMVEPLEEVIDSLTIQIKNHHIERVQTGNCTLELGFIFTDCLNNIERVADHCSNIAVAVLESADPSVRAHSYLHALKKKSNEEYRKLLNIYTAKYYIELTNK